MLKFQKLDKRMNWHNIYCCRVEFYPSAFQIEGKSDQETYNLLLDSFLKACKAMTDQLGYAPSAELTFRYSQIYGHSPIWATRDARSNLHGGNYYYIYVKSEVEKAILAKILKEVTGGPCN